MKKSVAILAAFAVVVFCLTEMCFWTVDDILYQYVVMPVLNQYSAEPITGLGDLCRSQYNHLFGYNGRIVAHTIVQIFTGLLGKHAFAICNVLVYCLIVNLILRLAGASWRNPLALLTAIGMCMLGFIEKYVPSYFVSYFYTLAIVLVWLLALKNMRLKFSIPMAMLLFFISALAGNSHECYSLPISVALFVYLILYRREWNAMQMIMVVGFWGGIVFSALMPGTQSKMRLGEANYLFYAFNIFAEVRCFYVMLVVLAVLRLKRKIFIRQMLRDREVMFWVITAASLMPIMAFVFKGTGWRLMYCVELASIIITLRVLPRHALPKAAVAALLLAVGGLYMYFARFIYLRSNALEEIVDLYAQSSDGVVYYDISTPLFNPNEGLAPRLYYGGVFDEMNGEVIARHPGAPPIMVLPTCCRDLVPETPSQAIKIDDGACVFINNKQHPASKFYVTLTRSIGFYHGAGGRYYFSPDTEGAKFELPNHEVTFVYIHNNPLVVMLSCGVELKECL